jgi:hypothetical protein
MPVFALECFDNAHWPDGAFEIEIVAQTLAEAFAVFTATAGKQQIVKRVTIGDLTLWSNVHQDYDALSPAIVSTFSVVGRALPLWDSTTVAEYLLRTAGSGADFRLTGAGVNDGTTRKAQQVAWTTVRAIFHLAEAGAVHLVRAEHWWPCPLSAHERLALPARLDILRRRDAAIRGDA